MVVLRGLEYGCRTIIVVAVVCHWYTCETVATDAPPAAGGGALPKVTRWYCTTSRSTKIAKWRHYF